MAQISLRVDDEIKHKAEKTLDRNRTKYVNSN